MEVFKKADKSKALKRLIKGLGMEVFDFNGYFSEFDTVYMTKKLDTNYILASYKLIELNGKVIPSYGTRIDLLDSFMVNHMLGLEKPELSEEIKEYYTDKVPIIVNKEKSVKQMSIDGYKLLYVRDNNAKEDSLIKTIDLHFVNDNDTFFVFRSLHYITSPDFAKTGQGTQYIELQGNSLIVPKIILNVE